MKEGASSGSDYPQYTSIGFFLSFMHPPPGSATTTLPYKSGQKGSLDNFHVTEIRTFADKETEGLINDFRPDLVPAGLGPVQKQGVHGKRGEVLQAFIRRRFGIEQAQTVWLFVVPGHLFE